MSNATEILQKAIDAKKESYRNHLKTHNHLTERVSEETIELQSLTKDIDSLGKTIDLIKNAESIATVEKNAPASASYPVVHDDFSIAINVIEGKDALKFLGTCYDSRNSCIRC